MFEEIIMSLEDMGVAYTEDPDVGTLTIDVEAMDKTVLIEVINLLNNAGLEFTIDDISIIVSGGEPVEMMEEEFPEEEDVSEMALEDMLGGGM